MKTKGIYTGVALCIAFACASSASAASLQTVSGFTNPGALTMQKYIPDGMPSQAPMVVVLHGCQQDGPEYYQKSGWKKMADLYKFALLVPTQPSGNNGNRCFNWFEKGDFQRGSGESASIVNAMSKVVADHAL
ncbi:MAG TPA: PHB depolymerase family esterase, partial [Rhodocyclaceae bacterium]|nr:PHB depolymerase family esterase [Rhodocyclaceae bacterium]